MKFKFRRFMSAALSVMMLSCVIPSAGIITSANPEEYPEEMQRAASEQIVTYAMDNIQDGTILHCFDWKYTDIIEELPNIAAAGFTSVQTSPAQLGGNNDPDASEGTWWWLYQPLSFSIGKNYLGTKEELTLLCSEADKYGIKIIVDIVANHLAGDHTHIQEDLKDSQYWHEVEDWDKVTDKRHKTTHKDLGMPDIKSEDSYVQLCVKNYIQELKEVGVDGLRWDTLKHIQLPSENCAFFTEVLDPDMYNYGESLGDPGGNDDTQNKALMSEYMGLMSVTDDVYGNKLRRAIASGNFSADYSTGNWANRGMNANRLVYWGESHDTWSNDETGNGGDYYSYSNLTDQNIVDRVYAVVASRSAATSLYFSRPSEIIKNNIHAGVKGSTHFTSPEVAQVNIFHNVFSGQSEKCSNSGTTIYTERGIKGVVIVNGDKDGGSKDVNLKASKMVDGVYTDQISGNSFTVADGYITGTIGSTGIAVVYNPGDTEEPYINFNTIYFKPNSNWKEASARFEAYFYNGSGASAWATLSDTDGDGIYEAAVPTGKKWTNVIFCRMNPAKPEGDWSSKWNKTNDLFPDENTDCYAIASGLWDEGESTAKGTWSRVGNFCDHIYSEPVWTWANDYSAASAVCTCTLCEKTLTLTDHAPEVSFVSNIRVHTAEVTTSGGSTYTSTKYEPMVVQEEPAGGVNYQIANPELLASIYEGILNHESNVDISRFNVPEEDFNKLSSAVMDCFPELFFIARSMECSYTTRDNGATWLISGVIPTYTVTSKETTDAMIEEFYEKADWYLDQIDPSWDDFTKALALHDLLVVNNYYQIEKGTKGQPDYVFSSNYTFMVDGWGRCENYDECYAFLLARSGIKSEIVSSDSMAHEWMMACLDGKYYHVDVTWDDPVYSTGEKPNKCRHTFFLVSDALLQDSAYYSNTHTGYTTFNTAQSDYDGYSNLHSHDNPFFCIGGNLYTVYTDDMDYYGYTVEKGVIATYDHNSNTYTPVTEITALWTTSGGGFYPYNFTNVAGYDGVLYFNDNNKIYAYNPSLSDSIDAQMQEPYFESPVSIWGMYIKDGKIYGLLGDDPNNTTATELIEAGIKKTYTVTWLNYDGTVLAKDESVIENEVPVYSGETPTKPADENYTYTFIGWTPEPSPVTANVTYTAVFEAAAPAPTVYFDNSVYKWDEVYAYIYNDTGSYTSWNSSPAMQKLFGDIYKIEIPAGFADGRIIFKDASGSNKYPSGDNTPGLEINNTTMFCDSSKAWYATEGVFASLSDGAGFTGNLQVKLYADNVTDAAYSVNGGLVFPYVSGTTITVWDKDVQTGESVTVTLFASKANGEPVSKTYTYNKGIKIYFDKPADWTGALAYVYEPTNDHKMANWPGEEMTYNSASGLYEYVVTGEFIENGRAIFVSDTSVTERYPLSGGERLEIAGKSHKLSKSGDTYLWKAFPSSLKDAKIVLDNTSFVQDGNVKNVSYDVVLVDGKVLTEGEDYEIEGDASALSPGTFFIKAIGIGDYSDYTQAKWTIVPAEVKVTVNGQVVPCEYGKNLTVTAPAAPEGEVFSHWTVGGKIISYSSSYSFIVRESIDLTAEYVSNSSVVEEQPVLDMSTVKTTYNGKSAVGFIFNHSIPEGYTVEEVGLLYSTNKLAGADTSVTDYDKKNLTNPDEASSVGVTDVLNVIKNNLTGKIKCFVANYKKRFGTVSFYYAVGAHTDSYVYALGYVKAVSPEGKNQIFYSNLAATSYNNIA